MTGAGGPSSGDGRDGLIVVGRIGRAHGVRGDTVVDVRTDVPERRFALGARLRTDPDRGALTIAAVRWHSGRLLVRFEGVDDRGAAEALRGTELAIPADEAGEAGPDAWWDRDLVGLRVELSDGTAVGEVVDVLHPAGPDLLSVRRPDGAEVLVPFVAAIVPEVDVAGGRLVLTPPDGLLDP